MPTDKKKPTDDLPVIDASDDANENWLRKAREQRKAKQAAGQDPDDDSSDPKSA